MIDVTQIQAILPHRYPFLLIDRVIDYDIQAGTMHGIKNVSMNESFFQGHFPGAPIMPGVLQIEAMAQTAGILGYHYRQEVLAQGNADSNAISIIAGIDKVRFKKPVVPGDQLHLHAKFLMKKRDIWKFECQTMVDGQLAASSVVLVAESKM